MLYFDGSNWRPIESAISTETRYMATITTTVSYFRFGDDQWHCRLIALSVLRKERGGRLSCRNLYLSGTKRRCNAQSPSF